MKHVIVKARKIHNVAGNMKYLRDTKDHPEICYTYSTCSDELWHEYAAVNQEEFKKSGKANEPGCRCVEAREQIFIFPEEAYQVSQKGKEAYARALAEIFKKKYGVEVMIALHGSDKDSKNLHVHIMFMERKKLIKEEKIATRRLYFNDKGRQVKSRKDAVDQDGNLLPGYYFVKKGEVYGEKEWTAKEQHMHSNAFTKQLKIWWANEINRQRTQKWGKDMEERAVYDRDTSPYLPYQDEYKPLRYSDPEKQKLSHIKAYELSDEIGYTNFLKRQWNEKVDQALSEGADLEDLVEHRKEISADIKNACVEHRTSEINGIIQKHIEWLEKFLQKLREVQKSLASKLQQAKEKIQERRSEHVPKPRHDRGGR